MSTEDLALQHLVTALIARDRETVVHHLAEWEARTDIADLDPRCLRLIPALKSCGQRWGIAVPFPAAVERMVRYWWLKHRWIERAMVPVVEELLAAGLHPVALKGLAVRSALRHPEIRTMADIDIALPPAEIAEAMRRLRALGFVPETDLEAHWLRHPKRIFYTEHAVAFTHPQWGAEIDLHWRLWGLIPASTGGKWIADAAAHGSQVKGWPDGLRAMDGLPLVRTLVANGYVDDWSSATWIVDLHELTAEWTDREWLELLESFERDGSRFVFEWAINVLQGVDFPLPSAVIAAVPDAPLSTFRRLLYAHDWEPHVKGLLRLPAIQRIRTAWRAAGIRHGNHQGLERWRIAAAFYADYPRKMGPGYRLTWRERLTRWLGSK